MPQRHVSIRVEAVHEGAREMAREIARSWEGRTGSAKKSRCRSRNKRILKFDRRRYETHTVKKLFSLHCTDSILGSD
jgi:osmotically-inducible protein OsmY